MPDPVHYAVIGVGGIGAYHLASISELEGRGEARLIAVADPGVENLKATKVELEGRGVRWYTDYRDLLEREADLDAIVIATPIPFHFEIAMACIRRGVHIHMEKPPVPLLWQLEELIAADRNQSVSVGFQYISSACTQDLKRFLMEGKAGEIREIRAAGCWPRYDSYYSRAKWAGRMTYGDLPVFDGPATNALAHVVHSIMFFAGKGLHEFDMPIEVEGELYRARSIESYDTACMRGRFASGIEFSAALTHSTESRLPFCIEVRGTKGWGRLSQDGAHLETSDGLICEQVESTQELLNINHSNFNEVLRGRASRFTTRLVDTRAYVGATNAMLLSSGGIHDIDPHSIRRFAHDGTGGYEVQHLREAVETSLHDGRLFSEQECTWAIGKPRSVRFPLNSEAVLSALYDRQPGPTMTVLKHAGEGKVSSALAGA
jgi:predicted dehydrogenase